MLPALLTRLQPAGPWRFGPDTGELHRLGHLFHSDTLYSAVCSAMHRMGRLEAWLDATARNEAGPAVRFSSLYPWLGSTLYVAPPRSHWPPPPSARLRSEGSRFVPAELAAHLAAGKPLAEDEWCVDAHSGCLLPRSREATGGPFRAAVRSTAPVDRLSGLAGAPTRTACAEFAANAGLWSVAVFPSPEAEEAWLQPVQAAFRLLADEGLGGQRSRGWGRSAPPEFSSGVFPRLVFPEWPEENADAEAAGGENRNAGTAHWLLSLYSPGPADAIDWERGAYSILNRGGRVESAAGWGQPKKPLRMVAEGSVLVAAKPPVGAAPDVAPADFPHPVYRSGHALSLPIHWQVPK